MPTLSVKFTNEDVTKRVAEINNRLHTKISFVPDGDFNNSVFVEVGGKTVSIGKGSLSVLYRNLGTFELGYSVANSTHNKVMDALLDICENDKIPIMFTKSS